MNHGNLEKGAWWAPVLVWAFWRGEKYLTKFKKRHATLRRVGVIAVAVET
jgi:hypothetical protein